MLPEVAQSHQQWQHEDIAKSTDGALVPDDVAHVGVEDGNEDEDDDEGGV